MKPSTIWLRYCSTLSLAMFEKDAEKKATDEKKLFGETMPKNFDLWESRMTTKFPHRRQACLAGHLIGHWLSRFR